MDHYSRTKAIADQLTLMANGTPLPGKQHGAHLAANCLPPSKYMVIVVFSQQASEAQPPFKGQFSGPLAVHHWKH